MTVELVDEQREPVDHERLRALAEHVLAAEGVPARMALAVRCVDRDAIAALNQEHMDGQGPTDVLAFPLDDPAALDPEDPVPALLGDVVLCPAVAREQAAGEPLAELELLLVHGILHLLGHDHAEEHERHVMFARTDALLGAFRGGDGAGGTLGGTAGGTAEGRERS